jgi:uncharacterized membrane protein YqiK
MAKGDAKSRKKEAKARAKAEKAKARAERAQAEAERERAVADAEDARAASTPPARMPEGVGVAVRKLGRGSELVVSGLSDEQLQRILPEVNKEVMIAVAAEHSALRAGLMRFVREGAFQTVVKLVAGLIVGYLLIRFGLR